VAALAIISALQEIMAEKYGLLTTKAAFPFRIKWPNDIYVLCENQTPLKVGGILCNSLNANKQAYNVIVGIGLNVSNREPTTCVNEVISAAVLQQATPGSDMTREHSPLDRETLLATIMNHFEEFQSVRCCCD
jgi:biotin---protein ligase